LGLTAALGVPGTLSHSLRSGSFPYLTYFLLSSRYKNENRLYY